MTEQATNSEKEVDEEIEEVIEEPAYKKWASYQGALLASFATMAAALLVIGNLMTEDAIALRIAEDLQASLSQVIPSRLHDNNLLENKLTIKHGDEEVVVYQGIKNNQITALAYSVIGQGYAGEIKLIMAVNAEGEVLGVRVISHAETPGLGDKIEVEKDDWIFSFNGLSFKKLEEDLWKVKKDGGTFDQFSGATITPRAIVKAVKQGLNMFHQYRKQLFTIEKHATEKKEKTPVATSKPGTTTLTSPIKPAVKNKIGNSDE